MQEIVTFIIPSKGRPTLANTLASLYEQEDRRWNAVVCYDAVEPTITNKQKIQAIVSLNKLGVGVNGAGAVRTFAIKNASNLADWVAFVDDDDTLAPNYVSTLAQHLYFDPVPDVISFSMLVVDNGRVIPRDYTLSLAELENDIGISFACNKRVFEKINFEPSSGEDFNFLIRAEKAGFVVMKVPTITYLVAPLSVAPDRRNK